MIKFEHTDVGGEIVTYFNIPNDTHCLKSKVNLVTCQEGTEVQYRYKLYSLVNFGT